MAPSRSLVLLALAIIASVHKATSETDSAAGFFSSRTTYDTVRGRGVTKQPGCTPVALWALVRNGVSYPSAEEIRQFARLNDLRERILDNHNNWKSGDLSEEVLESLRNWSFHVDPSKADRLAESGIGDLTSFIQRLQDEFPKLLHRAASKVHSIKHNGDPKAIETADIIASTLYNSTFQSELPEPSDISQTLGEDCPYWSKVSQRAEELAQEFRDSELVNRVVQNVSRRLGFNRLSFDLIRDAYNLCSYDRSISASRNSPWCSIFTPSDLEAFEYEEDILSYCTSGPGNPNVALIGCDFIRVFLKNFKHKSNANVNIQVASGRLIRAALASFGLASADPPLTADNFSSNRDRVWRNSLRTPYSGNIVAVLNECEKSEKKKKPVHTVSIYTNEIPLTFSFCGGDQYCEYSRFVKQFSSITDRKFCRKNIC